MSKLISMAFVIGTFQSHCKSETKSYGTYANLTVFFYIQNSTLLN